MTKIQIDGQTVDAEVFVARRDTRWDPYPCDTGERFLQTIYRGDVYRWAPTGWFRSPVQGLQCCPATDEVMRAFGHAG